MPPEAIIAAAGALNDALPGGLVLDEGPARRAAEAVLEAAAPHLAASRARDAEAAARARAAAPHGAYVQLVALAHATADPAARQEIMHALAEIAPFAGGSNEAADAMAAGVLDRIRAGQE